MKLNLYIAAYELSGKYDFDLTCVYDYSVLRLEGALPYNRERKPRGDRLYVARAEELKFVADTSDSPSFIVTGDPEPFLAEKKNLSVLHIKADKPIGEILSDVSELFLRYNRWYMEMKEISERHLPILNFGKLAEEMLGNPIHLLDEEYRLIFMAADSDRYKTPVGYRREDEYGDVRVVSRMLSMPEYRDMKSRKDIYSFKSDHFSDYGFTYDSISCNVYVKDKFFAYLYSDDIGHPFTDRDRALLLVIRDILSDYAANCSYLRSGSDPVRDSVIKELLSHGQVEKSMLELKLRTIGWNIEDEYVCIRVEMGQHNQSDLLLSNFGENIATILSACAWVLHQNALVLILNLRRMVEPYEYVMELIRDMLNACNMVAGVSELFHDFYNLVYAHTHAQTAISLSLRESSPSGGKVFFFENMRFKYYIWKCIQDDTIEALCPPGLLELARLDEQKGSDNIAVLRCYLENNMNAAETARMFFVHRNTMIYRLQQIEKTLNMDLTDSNNRLLLQWAIQILSFHMGS